MKRLMPIAMSLALILVGAACSPPQDEPDASFEIEATSPIQNEVEPTYIEEEAEEPDAATNDPVEEILEEDMTAEEIGEMDPIPPAADLSETAPAEEVAVETAPDQEAAAGDLAGTTWNVDGISVEFRDEDTVFLKGGQIAQFSPEGLEAEYTLTPNAEGGADLQAEVLGAPVTGTWDGTLLVINGSPATAQ